MQEFPNVEEAVAAIRERVAEEEIQLQERAFGRGETVETRVPTAYGRWLTGDGTDGLPYGVVYRVPEGFAAAIVGVDEVPSVERDRVISHVHASGAVHFVDNPFALRA